jgi:hypothetical protein
MARQFLFFAETKRRTTAKYGTRSEDSLTFTMQSSMTNCVFALNIRRRLTLTILRKTFVL